MASYASPTRSTAYKSRIPASKASSVSLGHRDRPRTPDPANSARKRSRYDFDGPGEFLPRSSPVPASPYPDLSSAIRSHVAPSPPPLIDSRYRLASGFDTPTPSSASHRRPFSPAPEVDFRKRWSDTPAEERSISGPLSRPGNGHKRTRSVAADLDSESWKAYVLRVAGGVAGKVWDFAAGGFKGFSAGGGTSYQMTDSGPQPMHGADPDPWVQIRSTPAGLRDSPIPGAFPSDNEGPRPAKRLQTSQGTEWVVVDQHDILPFQPSFTPRSTSHIPHARSASTAFTNRAPSRHSTSRLPTSSTRRPRVTLPRTASVAETGSPRYSQPPPSASFAPQRTPTHSPKHSLSASMEALTRQSPTQRDIDRWSSRREREERQADASMQRLNQQLKAMIKQGKAALETRYEVTEDSEYVDEQATAEDDDDEDFDHDGHVFAEIPRSAASPRARW